MATSTSNRSRTWAGQLDIAGCCNRTQPNNCTSQPTSAMIVTRGARVSRLLSWVRYSSSLSKRDPAAVHSSGSSLANAVAPKLSAQHGAGLTRARDANELMLADVQNAMLPSEYRPHALSRVQGFAWGTLFMCSAATLLALFLMVREDDETRESPRMELLTQALRQHRAIAKSALLASADDNGEIALGTSAVIRWWASGPRTASRVVLLPACDGESSAVWGRVHAALLSSAQGDTRVISFHRSSSGSGLAPPSSAVPSAPMSLRLRDMELVLQHAAPGGSLVTDSAPSTRWSWLPFWPTHVDTAMHPDQTPELVIAAHGEGAWAALAFTALHARSVSACVLVSPVLYHRGRYMAWWDAVTAASRSLPGTRVRGAVSSIGGAAVASSSAVSAEGGQPAVSFATVGAADGAQTIIAPPAASVGPTPSQQRSGSTPPPSSSLQSLLDAPPLGDGLAASDPTGAARRRMLASVPPKNTQDAFRADAFVHPDRAVVQAAQKEGEAARRRRAVTRVLTPSEEALLSALVPSLARSTDERSAATEEHVGEVEHRGVFVPPLKRAAAHEAAAAATAASLVTPASARALHNDTSSIVRDGPSAAHHRPAPRVVVVTFGGAALPPFIHRLRRAAAEAWWLRPVGAIGALMAAGGSSTSGDSHSFIGVAAAAPPSSTSTIATVVTAPIGVNARGELDSTAVLPAVRLIETATEPRPSSSPVKTTSISGVTECNPASSPSLPLAPDTSWGASIHGALSSAGQSVLAAYDASTATLTANTASEQLIVKGLRQLPLALGLIPAPTLVDVTDYGVLQREMDEGAERGLRVVRVSEPDVGVPDAETTASLADAGYASTVVIIPLQCPGAVAREISSSFGDRRRGSA